MHTSPLILDQSQQRALERLREWVHNGDSDIVLDGAAGAGKSTLISRIVREYPEQFNIYAPTAKAASCLRSKGLECQTVHSQTMQFVGQTRNGLHFRPKACEDVRRLGLVDECSMVSADMFAAVHEHCSRVIWCGDRCQLAPVGECFDLWSTCEVVSLDTVHRVDFLSSILDLCTSIRETAKYGPHFDKISTFATRQRDVAGLARYARFHQIDATLVFTNKLRNEFNKEYRRQLGHVKLIEDGERLICLKNAPDYGVYNGEMLDPERIRDGCYHGIPIRLPGARPTEDPYRSKQLRPIEADFGYAITTHKAQGSQYPRVLFVDDGLPSDQAQRLRYTGCSRAREQLHVGVLGERR